MHLHGHSHGINLMLLIQHLVSVKLKELLKLLYFFCLQQQNTLMASTLGLDWHLSNDDSPFLKIHGNQSGGCEINPGVLSIWVVSLSQTARINREANVRVLLGDNLVLLAVCCIRLAQVSLLQNNCLCLGKRARCHWNEVREGRREGADFLPIKLRLYFELIMAGYNLCVCVNQLWKRLHCWQCAVGKTAVNNVWFIGFPGQLGYCIKHHPLYNKGILCFLQEILWYEEILTCTMCRRASELSELVIVPALFHCSFLCSFPVSDMGPQFISVQQKKRIQLGRRSDGWCRLFPKHWCEHCSLDLLIVNTDPDVGPACCEMFASCCFASVRLHCVVHCHSSWSSVLCHPMK